MLENVIKSINAFERDLRQREIVSAYDLTVWINNHLTALEGLINQYNTIEMLLDRAQKRNEELLSQNVLFKSKKESLINIINNNINNLDVWRDTFKKSGMTTSSLNCEAMVTAYKNVLAEIVVPTGTENKIMDMGLIY